MNPQNFMPKKARPKMHDHAKIKKLYDMKLR